MKNKKAQEEMVGFGLIIVIVAVVLLVFVSLTFRKSGVEIESYEVESFLNSLLQKTTDCESFVGYIDVEDLIEECMDNGACLDGRNACLALNESIKEVLEDNDMRFNQAVITTIESSQQNMVEDKYEVQLVYLIRNLLEESDEDDIEDIIINMFNSPDIILKRILYRLVDKYKD